VEVRRYLTPALILDNDSMCSGDMVALTSICVVMMMAPVTAATDELNKAGTVFLQLKMVIDRGNKKRDNVVMGKLIVAGADVLVGSALYCAHACNRY